jgi:hypothetical protein
LKAPSLLAITVDSQRLLPQCLETIVQQGAFQLKKLKHIGIKVPKEVAAAGGYLSNKIADNTAIIDAHARTVCVEDPGNPYLN